MWVVSSAFGDGTGGVKERVLRCGESYLISRSAPTGKELHFASKSISKQHAFLRIDEAPPLPDAEQGNGAGEARAGAEGEGEGEGPAAQQRPKPLRELKLDWRPRIWLDPGKRTGSRSIYIKRPRDGAVHGAAPSEGGDGAEAGAGAPAAELELIEASRTESMELFDGDQVHILESFQIDIKWVPLAFCVMLKGRSKEFNNLGDVADQAAGLGIPIVVSQTWQPNATHLVLKRIALRPAIIDALYHPAPLVRFGYVRDLVRAAHDAERGFTEFTPARRRIDAALEEGVGGGAAGKTYVPEMPEVEDQDEALLAKLREALLRVRPRTKPLVGRSVLIFALDQREGQEEYIDPQLTADVFRCLGATTVQIHSLTAHPLRNRTQVEDFLRKAHEEAAARASRRPPVQRRHIQEGQQLIIWYQGDEATLPLVGEAASNAFDKKIPMPATIGGDLDWVVYGIRTWETLLHPYTGILDNYVDKEGETQAAAAAAAAVAEEERRDGPAAAVPSRGRADKAQESRAQPPAERATDKGPAQADEVAGQDAGQQGAEGEGSAAAGPSDAAQDGDLSAEMISMRALKQNLESRKRSLMDNLFDSNDGGGAPARPPVRSKAAQRRAAEAEKRRAAEQQQQEAQGASASADAAGAGQSETAAKKRRKGAGLDMNDLFEGMMGGRRARRDQGSSGAGGDRGGSGDGDEDDGAGLDGLAAPESTTRQLRAALEEESRSQAVGGGGGGGGSGVGARAPAPGETGRGGASIITQAIREEDEDGGGRSLGGGSGSGELPMTPLVDMDGVQLHVESAQSRREPAQRGSRGRKRTASLSPEREEEGRGSKSVKQQTSKRQKRGGEAREVESETTEHAAAHSQDSAATAAPAKPKTARGKRAADDGPDKDEHFLKAVATLQKRKKVDEFDKEFDQLRIAKPVFDHLGRRRVQGGEAEVAHQRGGLVKKTGEEKDKVDEEFLRFKELDEGELDCGLRGNFMQVDFIPLVVERVSTGVVQSVRIEADGRPNFKAFRRKGQAKRTFDPERVVPTVLDALPQLQIGDDTMQDLEMPKRTTYRGDEDDELEEDDADFTGLHPPSRTYSGKIARTATRFNFTLGDEDGQRASAQREEAAGSAPGGGRGRGAAPASGARAKGRGARSAPQYIEVDDEEDGEDSDPEASLLLNLDEEEGLDERHVLGRGASAADTETQFSVDSVAVAARAKSRGKKAAGPATATSKRSAPTSARATGKGSGGTGSSSSRATYPTAATTKDSSSELFRGMNDSPDPRALSESLPSADEDPSPDLGAPLVSSTPAPTGASAATSRGHYSGSVVPASRPMETQEEDDFKGFGAASGRRRRGGGAASGTGPSSSARSRSRY